jgi:hypothetical protein
MPSYRITARNSFQVQGRQFFVARTRYMDDGQQVFECVDGVVRVAFLSLAGHPRKSLVLRGEVWPSMDCKPQLLLLTNAADGTAQGQITLTNHFDDPVTLRTVAVDTPHLSLRVQTNAIGHSYLIQISAAELLENGDAGVVRIMTSSSTNTVRVYIPKRSRRKH